MYWSRPTRWPIFQSTPSLRKATLLERWPCCYSNISIHTFLAEGDAPRLSHPRCRKHFNPHLPCGRRHFEQHGLSEDEVFQSTPSLRKATISDSYSFPFHAISIHTFLAEGDDPGTAFYRFRIISIHTFLAEGDRENIEFEIGTSISIHTFLAEGDLLQSEFT